MDGSRGLERLASHVVRAATHGDPTVVASTRRAGVRALSAAHAPAQRLRTLKVQHRAGRVASRLRRVTPPTAPVGPDRRLPTRSRPTNPTDHLAG